jgi:hypothetical protein
MPLDSFWIIAYFSISATSTAISAIFRLFAVMAVLTAAETGNASHFVKQTKL